MGRGEVKNYRDALQQYKLSRGSAPSTDVDDI